MTLPYIYQSTHSISFSLSALTHFISLPYKIDGKEGQSVDTDFDILVSQFHINTDAQILNEIKNNMIKLWLKSKIKVTSRCM